MSPQPRRNLQNITLIRKEGWRDFVVAAPRRQPEQLTTAELAVLSPRAAAQYNTRRADWHANMGVLKTHQLKAVQEMLDLILESNQQDGDKAKDAIALSASAGLGKTTAVEDFGKKYHLSQIQTHGPRTTGGHERWPVCRITLTGSTTIRDFNRALLEFFAHPGADRGTAAQYLRRALDRFLSCQVRLLIVDDVHFLQPRSRNGVEVSNHFKFITSEFPVTLLLVGIGLENIGLFPRGVDHMLAQTGRRTTILTMDPYTDTGEQWRALLLAIEQRLVLANKHQGMLADTLSDYVYRRTGGHIGSLMTLINRGSLHAIRTGTEALTEELLDAVPIDFAAEGQRGAREAAHRNSTRRLRRQ